MKRRTAMHRFFVVALATSGVISCDRPPSTGKSASLQPSDQASHVGADGALPVNQAVTFQVSQTSDLQGPLQDAFLRFENARGGLPGTFTVELAPGRYHAGIDVTELRDDSSLTVVVSGRGAQPAVIVGGDIALNAAAVTLRNVVIDGVAHPAGLIRIHVKTSVTLDRVAVVDSIIADKDETAPIVELRASYDGKPTALIKDSWFVRNKSVRGDAAAFEVTPGHGRFAKIEFDNVVFAGNETRHTLVPGPAEAVRLHNVVFYEPDVSQALIYLTYPKLSFSIDGGVIAAKKVIDYEISVDAKRSDYVTAKMTGTTVRLAAPIPRDDIFQIDVQTKPVPGPPSWPDVVEAARQGEKPNGAKLGL